MVAAFFYVGNSGYAYPASKSVSGGKALELLDTASLLAVADEYSWLQRP